MQSARSYVLGAMDRTITTVERAFQLAAASTCTSIEDIRKRLTAEGYGADQIEGRTLKGQLRAIIKARHVPTPRSMSR